MSKYLELFTGSFDESIQEKTKLENRPYVAYSIKSKNIVYTIVPRKEDGTIKFDLYAYVPTKAYSSEYEAVDLGLPSGTLWADRNVGAKSLDDEGVKFQWGDSSVYKLGVVKTYSYAEVKSIFEQLTGQSYTEEELIQIWRSTENPYDLCVIFADQLGISIRQLYEILGVDMITNQSIDLCEYYKPLNVLLNTIKTPEELLEYYNTVYREYKYSTNNLASDLDSLTSLECTKYNNLDQLTTLLPEDDAATHNMGDSWKTPTSDEWKELLSNTTPYFILDNGDEYSISDYSSDFGTTKYLKLKSNNNDKFILFYKPNLKSLRLWCSDNSKTVYSEGGAGFYSPSGELSTTARIEFVNVRGVKP